MHQIGPASVPIDPEARPLLSFALQLSGRVFDQEKFSRRIAQLAQEYPGLRFDTVLQSQPSICVASELQLDMVLDRLQSEPEFSVELQKPKVIYLEPIMAVDITVPEAVSEAVIRELNSRGARIERRLPTILAHVRPRQMLHFRDFLRSLTGFKNTYYSTHLEYYQETVDLEPGDSS